MHLTELKYKGTLYQGRLETGCIELENLPIHVGCFQMQMTARDGFNAKGPPS